MSNRNELNSYVSRLQQRLRLGAWLRGAAIFTSTALLVTVLLVLLLNRFAFPAHGVNAARVVIFAALAAAAALGLALPLVRATRAWAVYNAEAANPELQQRLTTFQERESKGDDPFLELLAADTLARTQHAPPSSLVPDNRLFALGGGGLACLSVLLWMIAAAPGYLGYGASLLWTNKNAAPLYTIAVTPGDVTVRRNSDQLITAHVSGMHPGKARLFAHYQSAPGWEPVTMQAESDSVAGAAYQFVFAGLPENVEYYVTAGPLVSSHYKVRVVDLASVKEISVTYHYPAWTGLKPATEEHSGDLRAIEGTDAAIELEMDRPLKDGQFMLDDGRRIKLTRHAGNRYRGSIHLEKDGAYHVTDTDEGQQVRLSEDYFIATDKALPPEVAIARPGGDYRASPIEEVTVGVKASDPFALRDVHLHYSVNGGPNLDVSLLSAPGARSVDASFTLPLEDFKLAPGDLVSLYATAKDGHSEARTEISFIQVDPFEREFSQSQQSGGGGAGGGANNQTEISKREKELIAATWKQQNDKNATPKDAAAAGQFLSEAQTKLRDQVTALSVRMQSRDISQANEEFSDFDKDMRDAAAAMVPSAEKLKSMSWKDAIPLEQKALQALLRAEATFRKIEVAFGQSGGGGAGGGNSGRDLASLFDLELDTEKNQYETARTASPADQRQKEVEDALAKLDALAKRQEDLANQQHNPQQNFQERWQQEMLRREAEQLQRQLEQLTRNGRQSSSSQSASAGQNGSQSSRTQTDSSSSQSSDQRIDEALKRLHQASEEMKRSGGPQQSARDGQQAADELRQARNLLAGTQRQLASGKVGSLAREAERLTQEERAQADRINQFASHQQSLASAMDLTGAMARLHERDQLAHDRQQLSDDLSKLQKNLRDAAREMAPAQPGAAQNLRDALTEMDESDLDNHVQRTADWLRRGINPNSNGTETEIAQGLSKLSQQLQQAEKSVGQGNPAQPETDHPDQSAALNQVERLRSQLEAMAASQGSNRQPGQNRQSGSAGSAPDDRAGKRSGDSTQRGSDVAGSSGDIRYGGGAADGTVWGNINTGNNRYGQPGQPPASTDASADPADTERTYQQGLRELNQLRHLVKSDPQVAKEVAELARQMLLLDPKRFPGNPAMVEQMHRDLLSSVDRLELQLQRNGNGASSEARTGKSYTVPSGYQESVAEYYRRLSKNP
ncbi:MAG: hypothetical protein WB607_24550 [Candidatus Acidiferrum sp.]